MRGEYGDELSVTVPAEELPPRARRIHPIDNKIILLRGTTSACAENTQGGLLLRIWKWNYLRVRGEYMMRVTDCPAILELPPRARRIHLMLVLETVDEGTTSACAENTG